MTPFGRMLDVDLKTMTRQATDAALNDAGIEKSDLNAAYFANVSQGAHGGPAYDPGQRRRRPKGPHLAVTAAGKGSASPSRGPILWPAGMSPINK